jgi:hypothetical protein
MQNKKYLFPILFFFFSFVVFANYSFAIDPLVGGTNSELAKNSQCMESGDCKINDFIRVGISVTNIIIGLSGTLALVYFIYGGIMLLISAGSSDKVGKAKTILINAIIGLVLIFASYMIVNFVIKNVLQIKNLNWNTTPS